MVMNRELTENYHLSLPLLELLGKLQLSFSSTKGEKWHTDKLSD